MKVFTRQALREEIARQKAAGQRIVFTNGCFDLLHVGHIRYLREARKLGDALVVGVNSDDSVRQIKGQGRPIVPADERAELLAGLRAVDFVTVFEELDPAALVEAVQPYVLVKGGDYRPDQIVGKDTVERSGGRVVSLPLVPGRSTSDLVQRIGQLSPQGGSR